MSGSGYNLIEMNEVDTPEDDKDIELGEEEADEQGDNEVLVSHHLQHYTSCGAAHHNHMMMN